MGTKRLTLDDHDPALDECDSNGTVAQHGVKGVKWVKEL